MMFVPQRCEYFSNDEPREEVPDLLINSLGDLVSDSSFASRLRLRLL
jgi:hypothetical protein